MKGPEVSAGHICKFEITADGGFDWGLSLTKGNAVKGEDVHIVSEAKDGTESDMALRTWRSGFPINIMNTQKMTLYVKNQEGD